MKAMLATRGPCCRRSIACKNVSASTDWSSNSLATAGMIAQTKITELRKLQGVDWLSALKSGAIRTLIRTSKVSNTSGGNFEWLTGPEVGVLGNQSVKSEKLVQIHHYLRAPLFTRISRAIQRLNEHFRGRTLHAATLRLFLAKTAHLPLVSHC